MPTSFDAPIPWSREHRHRCGALVARRFDGRTPEGRLWDMTGRMGPHACPLDVPLPIDWHACRDCEQPVFEVASVLYDDVTIRYQHGCQPSQKPTRAPTKPDEASSIWQRFKE